MMTCVCAAHLTSVGSTYCDFKKTCITHVESKMCFSMKDNEEEDDGAHLSPKVMMQRPEAFKSPIST